VYSSEKTYGGEINILNIVNKSISKILNVKSILIVHPQFIQIGGAETVALKIMKRIVETTDAHITILTLEKWSLSAIAKTTGISLSSERVSLVVAKYPNILKNRTGRFYLLRIAYLHRQTKLLAKNFELCVSTYNEIDFRKCGIQYVHHPTFAPVRSLKRYEMINDPIFFVLIKSIMEIPYNFMIWLISRNWRKGFSNNVTMVNSQFMADWLKELYRIPAEIVHPDAVSKISLDHTIPWEEREFRFVTVGRISPDKKTLEFIDICKAIISVYPSAKFAIVGRVSDVKYYEKVKNKIADLGVSVEFYHNLENETLMKMLITSKFYIAPKKYEHFGISILEAVRAGCLTFVHNTGGQREIVIEEVLRYNSIQQLLNNIAIVLENTLLREQTLTVLKHHMQNFSSDNFNQGIDGILRLWQKKSKIIG